MLCLYRDKAELKPNKLVAAWMEILFAFWLNFVSSLLTSVFSLTKLLRHFFDRIFGKLLAIFVVGNTTSTVLGICKISSQNWEKECETIFNIYSSIFFQWYIESLFWTAFFLSTLLLEIFGITQHSNPMLKVWKCILSHLWQCESNDSPNSHQTILIT